MHDGAARGLHRRYDGGQEVMMVARQQASVAVSENAWPSIHAARGVVERIVSTGETVYGINTDGVGSRTNLTRRFSLCSKSTSCAHMQPELVNTCLWRLPEP